VKEAQSRGVLAGYQVEVVAMNDSSTPAVGAASARRMAADPKVIGVIGTYNSGVAAEVAPILEEAGIVMISPGNTNPSLTVGPDPARPARQYNNYFRVVTTDALQGPFLAQTALSVAQAKRAAVVSETKAVSRGLAENFSSAYTRAGGSVVLSRLVPDQTADFSAVLREIAPMQPDLVFFGGEYNVGATLSRQAHDMGVTAPVMGGDGMKDMSYISKAGTKAADGDLASSVGVGLASPSTRPFLAAYEAAGYSDPPTDFGPYAYDATNVLLTAAAEALDAQTGVSPAERRDILARVQAIQTTGVTGAVSFDPYGDTNTKVLTLYRVSGEEWVPVRTETLY
jgi:branched-chain amino acid transport system substrate-binding protein